MLIKIFILLTTIVILGFVFKKVELFQAPSGYLCNMIPTQKCTPETTDGNCNWINDNCEFVNTESELPSECDNLPEYIKRFAKLNPSLINDICTLPTELLATIESTNLSEESKIKDLKCIVRYRLGGGSEEACSVGVDNTGECFYDTNITANCRARDAEGILKNALIPDETTPAQEVITKLEKSYSDEDCMTLKNRGFQVECTYDSERNEDKSVFHLDRALNTDKKRIVFH